jgi:hypothetical protein
MGDTAGRKQVFLTHTSGEGAHSRYRKAARNAVGLDICTFCRVSMYRVLVWEKIIM